MNVLSKDGKVLSVDWSEVPDVNDFSPLPEGEYRVRISNATPATTRMGAEMWKLTLQVIEGKYSGRSIFDNVVFSPGGLRRAKAIFKSLKLIDDKTGEVDIEPQALIDRQANVTVEVKPFHSDKHDRDFQRNNVPFDGWRGLEGPKPSGSGPSLIEAETADEADELPF